ncbi:hypothetical protein CPS_2710 [Colwellia psychrerythraea 34H]|uniref:Uncharacterized protein n=1 Tax=Colwellia psychrerythraea (strain 34H / ATCC BAA-681) TaxID=167879 RepID=Q480U7_COLP3|nr:hypothetical protein CPS_2710 [Colwellia psychrerythraea 34H]
MLKKGMIIIDSKLKRFKQMNNNKVLRKIMMSIKWEAVSQ